MKRRSLIKHLWKAYQVWESSPSILVESKELKFINGFKYQTVEDFIIKVPIFPESNLYDEFCILYKDGTLLILKGFAWDGASGPTYDSKDSQIAAVVHDALYRLIRAGKLDKSYKDQIDTIFYNLLIKNGMSNIRAKIWYLGVKYFGKYGLILPKILSIIDR
jgi:hypothetical protein